MTALAMLVPHAGSMILLDRIEHWDATSILCRSRSHLQANNPLRRAGRLSAVCGVEYALQAAAAHGGLRAGAAQVAGYVAAIRAVRLHVDRLDDPALGELRVIATLEHEEAGGILYGLLIEAADGRVLLEGRASVALPPRPGRPA